MYRSKTTETVFVQRNHEQNCSKFKSINKQEFVIKKSCNVSPVSASFTVTLSKLFIVESVTFFSIHCWSLLQSPFITLWGVFHLKMQIIIELFRRLIAFINMRYSWPGILKFNININYLITFKAPTTYNFGNASWPNNSFPGVSTMFS